MKKSFIHFDHYDLFEISLYKYENDELNFYSTNLDELNSYLNGDAETIIFIPSHFFGFKHFVNSLNLKKDILKANVLNDIEDNIVSDISKLKFVYDDVNDLSAWIDITIINRLNQKLNLMAGNFIILPEHLLHYDGSISFLVIAERFSASFSDFSGFSGALDSFDQYASILHQSEYDPSNFNIYTTEPTEILPKSIQEKAESVEIRKLHLNFNKQKFINMNLFERSVSFQYLKSKMELSHFDYGLVLSSLLIIFTLPILTLSIQKSIIDSYKDNTVKIFQELNPNFVRLVNPRAQIDDLTKNVPFATQPPSENLEFLPYVEKLTDSSIKKIKINLSKKTINVSLENLSSLKMRALTELMTQFSITIDSTNLVEESNSLSGTLIINYDI